MFGGGVCTTVDVPRAFDDSIHDGVHVLSLSLGPAQDILETEELDGIAVGSLHAIMEGITVVCGKIFGGGVCTTVDVLKAFDDTIHNGANVLSLSLGPGQDIIETEELDGIAVGFSPAVMEGITVVCAAGNYGPSPQSVTNMAPWIITVAADDVDTLFHDFTFIRVDYEIGAHILHYIGSERSPTMKLLSPSRTLIGKSITPRVAFFSSRGLNYVAPAILKPDITASGVNIFAAKLTTAAGKTNETDCAALLEFRGRMPNDPDGVLPLVE
ncbi:hypothetical protein MLD38_037224 [Melastoma candidum]|uniref:Uncharacterized protein n=1 Tax=Melastoma candidum TaxID=119954 RepID=A0ACB9LM71_9MYRT|nr:hypothetical protein MLD38_037224 [Melastoma candidum]